MTDRELKLRFMEFILDCQRLERESWLIFNEREDLISEIENKLTEEEKNG